MHSRENQNREKKNKYEEILVMEPPDHCGLDTPIFPFNEEAGLKCN